MREWQQRVAEEVEEFIARRERLVKFMGGTEFSRLPEEDKTLLQFQVSVMQLYLDVLFSRMSRFKATT